jgi:hypothetical protein
MPTLLKRQIRKYLSNDLAESKDFEKFLGAISSYRLVDFRNET